MSTSVTRSIVPFLSMRTSFLRKCAICSAPARTTTSMAVERKRGSRGTQVLAAIGAVAWRVHTLQHADFHAALRRGTHLDVVHECPNQEDTPTARLQQILGSQRICQDGRVETLPLVADADQHLERAGELEADDLVPVEGHHEGLPVYHPPALRDVKLGDVRSAIVPPSDAVVLTPAARIRGRLRVPGDKSISHRYAILAALADGQSSFDNFAPGADCRSTLSCLLRRGVEIASDPAGAVRIVGRGLG